MALEAGTYINQLVASNPNGADPKGQGDDHIRLIKQVLKNTFPNISGPVVVNQDSINYLQNPSNFFVRGMVMPFYGNINQIPGGWSLCDGTNNTPDLTDRFIMGAGRSYLPAEPGGQAAHVHNIAVAGTSLTPDQLPVHRHSVMASTDPSFGSAAATMVVPPGAGVASRRFPGLATPYVNATPSASYTYVDIEPKNGAPFMSNVGSGAAHSHTAAMDGASNIPPFVALYFIMRQ